MARHGFALSADNKLTATESHRASVHVQEGSLTLESEMEKHGLSQRKRVDTALELQNRRRMTLLLCCTTSRKIKERWPDERGLKCRAARSQTEMRAVKSEHFFR